MANGVSYNRSTLQGYASSLYLLAGVLWVGFTIAGALPSLVAPGHDIEASFRLIGLAVGGGVGFVAGWVVATILKVIAQLVLCLVQIEANTRARDVDQARVA